MSDFSLGMMFTVQSDFAIWTYGQLPVEGIPTQRRSDHSRIKACCAGMKQLQKAPAATMMKGTLPKGTFWPPPIEKAGNQLYLDHPASPLCEPPSPPSQPRSLQREQPPAPMRSSNFRESKRSGAGTAGRPYAQCATVLEPLSQRS